MADKQYNLGRIAAPDERDKAYPLRQLIPDVSKPTYKYWARFRKILNQGQESTCVGFSWRYWLDTAPVISHKHKDNPSAGKIYDECTKVDEWPGNEGDRQFGTSVRAGAKVLQAMGHVVNYYWALTLDDVIDCLLLKSPIVVGTNWYNSMFEPDKEGIVTIKPDSFVAGGHAFLLDGVNTTKAFVSFPNSWGKSWGNNGRAKLSFEDLERLLGEAGEACCAQEARIV